MKRVFLDTNVLLDSLLERKPLNESANIILSASEQNKFSLHISALSIATANFLLLKAYNREITLSKLRNVKILLKIVSFTDEIIQKSISSEFSDTEDAFQYFSALEANAEVIITRNIKDFKKSSIPVKTPEEFLLSLL